MTLEKAIEILSDSAYRGMTTFHQDFKDAQKLGIEALKVVHKLRHLECLDSTILLPGETKE